MDFNFEDIFIFQLTPIQAFANLSAALICGIIISILYRVTYRGVNYSSNYVIAIIMLTMITALVIMVIGNNLARAFGLVGAMSIIRFRTAVKDTQDIMFIFFALAIGLSSGAGMFTISLIGTFFIGLTSWIAVLVNSENPKKTSYLLQIYSDNAQQESDEIESLINRYCSKPKLINIKSIGDSSKNITELSYYINFKKNRLGTELVEKLKSTEGITKVNLFYDED